MAKLHSESMVRCKFCGKKIRDLENHLIFNHESLVFEWEELYPDSLAVQRIKFQQARFAVNRLRRQIKNLNSQLGEDEDSAELMKAKDELVKAESKLEKNAAGRRFVGGKKKKMKRKSRSENSEEAKTSPRKGRRNGKKRAKKVERPVVYSGGLPSLGKRR